MVEQSLKQRFYSIGMTRISWSERLFLGLRPTEMKRALITGITGQDGSYLAEFLLEKGYQVYGLIRRSSTVNFERISHLQDRIQLIPGDLLDSSSLISAIQVSKPHELYNLAAQSFVPTSWNQPVLTGDFTALGVTRVLEAVRVTDPS